MEKRFNTKSLVLLGLLMAIVVLFSTTPIGSIPVGPLVITLNVIPIAIAAVALGPTGGLIVGTFFGLFSFLQCFGIGIPSGMGAALANINPVLAFIQRVIPRALDGFLVGWIFKGISRLKSQRAYYIVTGGISALFGLALFLSIMQIIGYDKNGKNNMTEAMYSFMTSKSLVAYVCIAVALLCFAVGYMLVSSRKLSKEQVSYSITGFCTAIFNTIFFMSALIILFGKTQYMQDLIHDKVASGNILLFVLVFVGINALVEMVVCTFVTCVVGSALHKAKLIGIPEKKD